MPSSQKPESVSAKPSAALLIFAALCAVQLAAAGVFTLSITSDAQEPGLGGYSPQRLALAGLALVLAITALLAGLFAFRKRITLTAVGRFFAARPGLSLLALLCGGAGWLALTCPPYRFGAWMYYFERVRPLAAAVGLIPLELWLLSRLPLARPLKIPAIGCEARRAWRAGLYFTAAILALAWVISVTGAGWVGQEGFQFWNVAGMPLSSFQALALLLTAGLFIFSDRLKNLFYTRRGALIAAALLFAIALAVWNLTPMLKHFYALAPAPPAYQPYPYSDARDHDLGALSILQGTGVFFRGFTDKPLYMVFLAGLHLLAGDDYQWMSRLQSAFLALTPAALFCLGLRFHSLAFGLLLSLSVLLRQRNAIALAHQVSSVNPQLLVTETVTLLAVAALTALVFRWFTTRRLHLALLAGALAGAASLVRLNPLFLFLAGGLLAVPVFYQTRRALFQHLGLYALGFALLLSPWLLTGVDPQGRPWLLVKIENVIQLRYPESSFEPSAGLRLASPAKIALAPEPPDVPEQIISHTLHNLTASLLALPDSPVLDDLPHLSQRAYWLDTGGWQGDLPPAQAAGVALNLVLVAAGLGFSWARHRWAGMLPLAFLLAYALSLGLAMTSGGRYIMPIDWVVFFYWGMGLILVMEFLRGRLQLQAAPANLSLPHEPDLESPVERTRLRRALLDILQRKADPDDISLPPDRSSQADERRRLLLALIGVLIAAALVPFANLGAPLLLQNKTQAALATLSANLPAEAAPGESWLVGEALYPYLGEDGTFSFTLMYAAGAAAFSSAENEEQLETLRMGDPAALLMRGEQPAAVFRWQDGAWQKLWEAQP